MRAEAPGAHTVVVVTRQQDHDGDWHTASRTALPGCSVQPTGSTDDNDAAREQTTRRFTVFGPSELAGARAGDLLEVPGWLAASTAPSVALRIDAMPLTWPDEHGHPHHVEATAVLVAG